MGSLLCGREQFIREARRWRKVLGGGMRQTGFMAAAGIYALENNIERLSEDQKNAEALVRGLREIEEIGVRYQENQTHMLFLTFMEIREHLEEGLKGLSEVRREVVLLHDLEGWKHREIGERLGIPDGTVRSHLHFARKHLRDRLGAFHGSAPEGEES